jgi:hypothetical protein
MAIARLVEMIRTAAADRKISRNDVESLLRIAQESGTVTMGERAALRAALEDHSQDFEPDARTLLQEFLAR